MDKRDYLTGEETHGEMAEFLEDSAKLWLAHDGLWFLAVERKFGMDMAIELDIEAWKHFSPIEASRIMKRFKVPHDGGIDSLEIALKKRLYYRINDQKLERVDKNTLRLFNVSCRVQKARERQNMELFPCKRVGQVEYETFAHAVDKRITTTCLTCPPDKKPEEHYCGWEFRLGE